MNNQIKELLVNWNELKNKQEVKLVDIERLEKLFGNALQKMQEISDGRDKWKERALVISLERIDEWAEESFSKDDKGNYTIDGIKIPIEKLKKLIKH